MKKLLFSLFAIAITTVALAQKAEDVINFKELKYDFGKIKQGVPVHYDFVFTNVSDKPVVVENAWATCGCTTPEKPEQPVAKGKSNKIKAGFNAAALGTFDRTVYVKVQGIDAPVELKIVGEVLNADAFAQLQSEKKNKGSK